MPRKKAPEYMTLRAFAAKQKKDVSYINQLTRKFKIKLIDVKRKKDGRIVKTATLKQWESLLSSVKSLKSKTISKKDITLTKASKILKMEKSNLLKFAKKHKVFPFYASNGKTRVINCFSKTDMVKLQKFRDQLQ